MGDKTLRPSIARWEWLALSIVMLTALGLRLWLLPRVPGLWYDEAINGLDALGILRNPGFPIFFDTNNHMREPLFMYLELIGVLIGGTSAIALRSVSLVIAMITIPVVWWLAREWKGPVFAILAAVLMATTRWHIIFSCLAFRTIMSPLFMTLAALFFLRLIRHGKRVDAVLCGVALGVGAYTYLAFRLAPLIFAVPMVVELIRRFRVGRETGRLIAARFGLLVGSAFLVFLPLGVNYIVNPQHFTGRGGEVSYLTAEGGGALLLRQTRDVALMPLLRGDHEGKHNIPGPPTFLQLFVPSANQTVEFWGLERQVAAAEVRQPMDPHGTGAPVFSLIAGSLFYVGFVVLIWNARRDSFCVLILSWLLIGSLASILSYGAPNMLRLQFLVPAVVYTVAAGYASLVSLERRLPARNAVTFSFIVVLGVGAFGGNMIRDIRLLNMWPTHPMVADRFNTELAGIGDYLRMQGDRLTVVLPPQLFPPPPTLAFLADGYHFTATAPTDEEYWWELRTRPPFPRLEHVGQPIPMGRVKMVMHPVGIPFAELVAVEKPSPSTSEESQHD